MIRVPMTASSLATSRFAVSRMAEAFDGIRAVTDPATLPHLRSWVRWARPRLRGLDLSLLHALARSDGYIPDFLVPPPPAVERAFEDDLADLRATPHDRLRAELAMAYRRQPLPARIRIALADGEQAFLDEVADALRRFWYAVMEPWWPAVRTMLEDDISYRARVMARHGAAVAFTQMDRSMGWNDSCLYIATSTTFDADWADSGVIFAPTLFGGPHVYLSLQPWLQSVIYYPVRNVVNDRVLRPHDGRHGSAELMGRTRASIFSHLDHPRSTKDLAARLELAPSTVSYHLGVLYRAGLLDRAREGRDVLYWRV